MRQYWWKVLCAILLFYSFFEGLLGQVPAREILNETIRNLYFHVPMWFTMIVLFAASAYYVLTGTVPFEGAENTELINNAPKICYDYIVANSKVGMVTCQLQYPDGRIQPTCRRFRTITWELLEVFPVFKFLSKEKQGQLMLHHYFDHKTFADADWVWGAFMLFPKSIIQQLPEKKLSDLFFMYCEDTLWCWDFKQLGYDIHYLPQAQVMHIHKGSVHKDKWIQIRKTGIKNHALFMKQFYPDVRWYIFAAIYFTKQYAALWWGKLKG